MIEEGKQATFGECLRGTIARCAVVEDKTSLAVTKVPSLRSTGLPHALVALDANLIYSGTRHKMSHGCYRRMLPHTGDKKYIYTSVVMDKLEKILLWVVVLLLHLAQEVGCQRLAVLFLVSAITKRKLQVGTYGPDVLKLDRVADAEDSHSATILEANRECGSPDVGAKVFPSTAFACHQKDDLRMFGRNWEWASLGKHVLRIKIAFEPSQA